MTWCGVELPEPLSAIATAGKMGSGGRQAGGRRGRVGWLAGGKQRALGAAFGAFARALVHAAILRAKLALLWAGRFPLEQYRAVRQRQLTRLV